MAVTGAILPKHMPMYFLTWKKKTMQHMSVVNKNKQKIEMFVISNIGSIVSYQSKKAYQNEIHSINDLLKCSMSSAYRNDQC